VVDPLTPGPSPPRERGENVETRAASPFASLGPLPLGGEGAPRRRFHPAHAGRRTGEGVENRCYQFNRKENWICREFSAELIFPKFEVP
jgi:hypothetical protein